MGRKKKIKTQTEINEYLTKRREQNRINQQNYRRRIKIVNFLKEKTITPTQNRRDYVNEMSRQLKEFDFNYYITLTTQEISNVKSLFHIIPNFIRQLKSEIKLGLVFYVVEKGKTDHPHIHLLIKSQSSLNKWKTIIKNKWKNGFVDIQRIYSVFDDYTLEKYVMKEVSILSNDELMWDFV